MTDKTFHTYEEYKRHFFPMEYAKIIEEKKIKEAGSYGTYLARKHLEDFSTELAKALQKINYKV